MPDIPQKDIARRSKDYSIQGYILSLAELVYLLVFLLLFQGLGFSARLAKFSTSITFHNSLSLLIYLFWLTIIYYLVGFPLFLYHSFIRERRFGLSGQKLSAWLKDQLKSLFIMYLVAGISLEVFYYFLRLTPVYWWLIVSFFWILLNLLMARIAPQVIIPLFFKCSKLEHGVLRERIVKLAAKMGVKIVDVFEIDFSKKTYKANAAFVGLGSSQKVLLADTLKEKFSDYEVEVIVAHEFAHYLRGHLLKLIVINSCTAIVCFYLIYRTSFWFFSFYNLTIF
ncbi:MAG: M48 family metalloprotease [Candidatus Omnitrophica bacterium]|nr:M48 family metalloprotease [Candidatus Omnitrophota bacterium]